MDLIVEVVVAEVVEVILVVEVEEQANVTVYQPVVVVVVLLTFQALVFQILAQLLALVQHLVIQAI
jgi:hypothetical protein